MLEYKTLENTFSLPRLLIISVIFFITLLLGIAIGRVELIVSGTIVGLFLFCILVLLRQDELLAVLIVGVHLYVDWYLGGRVIALMIACLLVLVFYLDKSFMHSWTKPRFLPFWILFIVLGIFPAMRGFTLADGFTYYINTMVGAFIVFLLGAVVAKNIISIKKIFSILSVLGILLASVTLFQAVTGVLILGSSRFDSFLLTVSDFTIGGASVHRTGAFFIDPNWNGAFFAMMLFIPLGIFFNTRFYTEKIFYAIATTSFILSLMFTYSNGAWIGALAGLVAFFLLVGKFSHRLQIVLFIVVVSGTIVLWFPQQVLLQLQHASEPSELSLRLGAWETAVKIIKAFPFTGVGLGLFAYLDKENAFRVPAQYIPLAHPHNSYLELGAMGGLQIAVLFIILLILALYSSILNWKRVEIEYRPLFAGGIAAIVALTINSLSINGWTLPPLTALGWLILGILSSPLIAKAHETEEQKAKK